MLIISANAGQPVTTDSSKIPIGTTFRGTIGDYTGLFLRCVNDVVLLDDVRKVWSAPETPVSNYVAHDVALVDRGPARSKSFTLSQ